MDRKAPALRVQIGNEVVLRCGEVEVLARDVAGRPAIMHMRPQLRPGEILCERLGDIPLIVTHAECSTLVPSKPTVDFDTWMRNRVEAAHADFMANMSRRLPCDWRVFPPEHIAAYLGIDPAEVAE